MKIMIPEIQRVLDSSLTISNLNREYMVNENKVALILMLSHIDTIKMNLVEIESNINKILEKG